MNKAGIMAFAATCAMLSPTLASAHRLDEYLQATTISLARDHITLHLRLTPGVQVAQTVIQQMDSNEDGNLSVAEQQAYVSWITQTLLLSLNGRTGHLAVESAMFPSIPAMKTGAGVIDLQFRVPAHLQSGTYHLTYTNKGMGPDTAWLVNCLVPKDASIRVIQQKRSENQSFYALDFTVRPS
ncbi:hypothetical protein [Acetobacter sp.]|uniref:hypothetical protein n=1 Tax=Acetobacter sp. TaxID=440 RepID=UPI0039E8F22D